MRTPPPADHPRVRHGAHRTGRSVLGALMPSALAVAAVASLITALAVWQGEEPDQPRAAAATTSEKAQPGPSSQAATRSQTPAADTPSPATETTASTADTKVA